MSSTIIVFLRRLDYPHVVSTNMKRRAAHESSVSVDRYSG